MNVYRILGGLLVSFLLISCKSKLYRKDQTLTAAEVDSISSIRIDSLLPVLERECQQKTDSEITRMADSLVRIQKIHR